MNGPRLTDAEISNHRVVALVNEWQRPGYSYRGRETTILLERDYWSTRVQEAIARARAAAWSVRHVAGRAPFRRNVAGMMGSGPLTTRNASTLQADQIGNTGIRHITFNDTSATAHTLPANKMHLTRVSPFGGAALGSLILGYKENRFAHFSVPITSIADYAVDYTLTGNQLASGFFTTDGTAPASWGLTFAENSWGGLDISQYLAIRVAVTAGGAVTTITNITAVAFDAGESVPIWLQAYAATAAIPAVLFLPGEPGFQGGANAQDTTKGVFPAPLTPVPRVSKGNNITLAYLAAAAGLVTAYVGYKPTGS